MTFPTITASLLCVLCVLCGERLCFAGELNPPAGVVAPTPGPEPRIPISAATTPGDADSLFKITQPGSYYLVENLNAEAGKHGIEIVASGVTLDLMGFEVLGKVGSLDGITATAAGLSSIAVANGSIRSWDQDGVDLATSASVHSTLVGLRAGSCGGMGLRAGRATVVSRCTAGSNGSNGIALDAGGVVDCCTTYLNTGSGIAAGIGSTVTGCSSYLNTGRGIEAALNSTIRGSTAYENGDDGIVGGSTTITECTSNSNGGDGIIGSFSTITGCTVLDNAGIGINAGSGGTVEGCTASGNTSDGIRISGDGAVRDNTCDLNGFGAGPDAAGVRATGSDNRIEGNTCTDNDRGIDVDAAGNIIARNTCSGNTTNWDVVAGNVCLVVSATTGSAINGNSGGVAPGSTDPNANFTY